ncbi:MAG: class I SAM-dependent methyltransferase [Gemmatimonadota bacterium]
MGTTTERDAVVEREPAELDETKVEAFGERMTGAFNEAALMMMVSIGHRTGLFDVMSGLEWSTSEEIAEAAGLRERYVREWLAAMATGRIVEVDESERFRLPPEHAAMLTREAPENLAVIAQYFPVIGTVENDIVRCFREGGGVPYERFDRFHEVMAEDSGQTVVAALHDQILPLVPGIRDRLAEGIRVVDLGCGRGRALLELAARYPASEFVGIDLSEEAIGWARRRAAEAGLENVEFEARDLSDFDETAEPEAYDFVTTFDAVHDQARPAALLRGIARTLRPDGVYLMQDIHGSSHLHANMDHPLAPLLYTISCTHCMTVSLAQGGEGLGTLWGRERALEMLREAGFAEVEVHRLEHDIMNDFYVCRTEA